MQLGGGSDYNSYYYHQPPPSTHHQPASYSSAPPYSTTATTTPDYPSSAHPSFPHLSPNPDPVSSYPQPTEFHPHSQSFNPPYVPDPTHPTHPVPYPNYPNPPPSSDPASYPSPYPVSSLPAYNSYEPAARHDNSVYLEGSSGGYSGQGYPRVPASEVPPESYARNWAPRDRTFAREDDVFGDGVYAYDGGRSEPYGSRGTSGKVFSGFDDFGRVTGFSSGREQASESGKIVRAVPKVETQQDARGGVQKFRVKLLAEGSSQGNMDVLCQIGLDGIRMLDPHTNRTLRIYPLDTITRWEVNDPSIYSVWSKSTVDIEPRRIRLQSNRYTTNTILDTVTAATVQLKEMGVRSKPNSDAGKPSEPSTERKKGFVDWITNIKPANEEKDHWVPDEAVSKCTACGSDFGAFNRKHHCRNCGDIFCDKCTSGRIALTNDEQAQPVRVCDRCLAEVTQRLSNAKEVSQALGTHSHEDLAKKLQEEMEKNHKSSSGSRAGPDGSGRRMREVACPICTVHLQVQVPISGSETIECGVCQHPFLVNAH